MTFLFKYFKNRPLLGIDISCNAIYLVALSQHKQGFSLQHCAKKALPRGTHDSELITTTLQQMLAQENIKIKSAAIAIEHSAALFKTIEVDASLTEDEIMSHVEQRVSQYFNQPIGHSLLDFEILTPAQNQTQLKLVRWIAAKKQPISHYIAMLKQAGLTTVAVDINAYVLQRAAHYCLHTPTIISADTATPNPPTIAVIYINDISLLFTASDHEIPLYTLSEPNKSDSPAEALATFTQRALQLYQRAEPSKPITYLALCGTILDLGIATIIEQLTHIPTQVVTSPASLSHSNPPLPHPAHEYLLSIGLAMRSDQFCYEKHYVN